MEAAAAGTGTIAADPPVDDEEELPLEESVDALAWGCRDVFDAG
jgi:hypothetical protein